MAFSANDCGSDIAAGYIGDMGTCKRERVYPAKRIICDGGICSGYSGLQDSVCLVVGSVSPLHEIKRALINSYGGYEIETVEDERILNATNFAGSLDTFFWRHIAGKDAK